MSKDEAKSRAWATVNKEDGGGNLSGSGRGVPDVPSQTRRRRERAVRSRAAKKGWATRRKNSAAAA